MVKRSLVTTVLLACLVGLFAGASPLQARDVKFISNFKGYMVGALSTLKQARNSGFHSSYYVCYRSFDYKIGEIRITNSCDVCTIEFYLYGRNDLDLLLIGKMKGKPLLKGGRPLPDAWEWEYSYEQSKLDSGSFVEYEDNSQPTPRFNALEYFYYPSCSDC